MKYVKHFDILGVDTAQIPCIELQGVPNAATVGAVGLLGMDMTSEGHEIYKCVAVNGSVYTWECIVRGKDGTCVNKAEIIDGKLIFTLSDGSTINAGKVMGDKGADGVNGTDGISVEKVEIDENGDLITTMSDGREINVGKAKGTDGVSVIGMEFNENGELVLMLSNGTSITGGRVIPTLQDWLGTHPIGNEFSHMYYDGERFVTSNIGLEDMTDWEKIASASAKIAAGEDPSTFGLAVGQEKTITLTTGEEVTFVILGFNHDDLSDGGGKAGITFGMKGLLSTKYSLHGVATKPYSGWAIRDTLTEIYDTLPPDLRVIIKDVTKLSNFYNYSVNPIDTTVNKLFLFSVSEVFSGYSSDGSIYEYYASGLGNTKKFLNNGYGSVSEWAFRSRSYSSGVGSLIFVSDTDGNPDDIYMTSPYTYGICFGFCI